MGLPVSRVNMEVLHPLRQINRLYGYTFEGHYYLGTSHTSTRDSPCAQFSMQVLSQRAYCESSRRRNRAPLLPENDAIYLSSFGAAIRKGREAARCSHTYRHRSLAARLLCWG